MFRLPVLSLALSGVLALAGCAGENSGSAEGGSGSSGLYGSGSAPRAAETKPEPTGPEPLVEIETPYGTMTAKLYNGTPQHRDNFVQLANQGFYDGLLWHRVIPGFMIQGGDPDSRDAEPGASLGQGGPGYRIPAEIENRYIHKKGALAAARMGDQVNPARESSGSQFYIVQGQPQEEASLLPMDQRNGYTPQQKETYYRVGGTPFLDRQYTVFGEVIDGLEVIDAIAAVKTGERDRPEQDVWMKVRVLED